MEHCPLLVEFDKFGGHFNFFWLHTFARLGAKTRTREMTNSTQSFYSWQFSIFGLPNVSIKDPNRDIHFLPWPAFPKKVRSPSQEHVSANRWQQHREGLKAETGC